MDRVSTAGYAVGYVGGGHPARAQPRVDPEAGLVRAAARGRARPSPRRRFPSRLAFLSVAVWWLLFSIPLFRRVPEPPRALEPDERAARARSERAFARLGDTFRELRGYRQAFLMLLAFLIYNDGIQTIIKMATAYGTEIGIGQGALIAAILLVQFVGIPFSFLFGMLAGRIGAKRALFLGLPVYTGISVLGYFMTTATHFFVLAGLVGMVQGGTQALSRSLFASMMPQHKSGEFFGFFSVFEKFAGIFGPLHLRGAIAATGSSRNAILSVIAFFVGGRRAALAGERRGGARGSACRRGVAPDGALAGISHRATDHVEPHLDRLPRQDGGWTGIPAGEGAALREALECDEMHLRGESGERLPRPDGNGPRLRAGHGQLVAVRVRRGAARGDHDRDSPVVARTQTTVKVTSAAPLEPTTRVLGLMPSTAQLSASPPTSAL